MASPTPVLPEVGSTIVPPGWSSPEASAASIIRVGDPVLHRAAGVEVLDLGQHERPSAPSGRGSGRAGPAGCCRPGRGASSRTPCRQSRIRPVRLRSSGGRGEGRRGAQAGLRRGVRRRRPLRAGRRRSTACCAPRRRSPGGRSATPSASRRPTPPAGTAAAAPARRSRSRCSATPAPPATASTASRRPPAPSRQRRSPSGADRRVHLRAFAVRRRPVLATWPARSTGRSPTEPDVAVILIGANDVTHRVLPVAVRAAPRRGRTPAARGRRRGRGRHLPRPRHHQADPAAAQAGRPRLVAPAGGRPDHRGRRGRRPHGLARLDPRARSSRPRRRCSSGPTSSTPRRTGYRALAAVLLPSVLAALGLIADDEPRPRRSAARAMLPIAAAAVAGRPTPGTELDGTEVGGAARRPRPLGASCAGAAGSRRPTSRLPTPRGPACTGRRPRTAA